MSTPTRHHDAPLVDQLLATARIRMSSELTARDPEGAADFLARFDRWAPDLIAGLQDIYPLQSTFDALVDLALSTYGARDQRLRERDRQRLLEPDWFQRSDALGYVAYTDRFAGDLSGVRERIDYLHDLGITYLHLMPLLKPRPGANDGGYAVMDYRTVRAELGTMADLRELANDLHAAGISLTLDLVLNHVAREHEWAVKARAGEKHYADYFYLFEDREVPDAFEETLPEVFPDFAPGNFTWDETLGKWVWTTFNSWQWDVNWSNPAVLCEYADIIGFLANQGVDCVRLDAIAFLWKRKGTNCQNQPEVHAITQVLRAFARICAPALIFKAEAIVGPDDVGAYLGEGEHAGKVSDLAYHNSAMVQIWSAMATKNAQLMEVALRRFSAIPITTSWATYVRCHDDIGWAIDDADASNVGWDGFGHRSFLASFYSGDFYGSWARGEDFQANPATGDRRTSGGAASLMGIEAALESGDVRALSVAEDRYICAYAMVLGFGGLPLIYMGDEIGLLNDLGYTADPALAADNRWMHRPTMDWSAAEAAARGDLAGSVATRLRSRMNNLIAARKRTTALHAGVGTQVKAGRSPGIVLFLREHPAGNLVQVYNLTAETRQVGRDELSLLAGTEFLDVLNGRTIATTSDLTVPAYRAMWLSTPA
jgi:amylosucrase